MPHDVRAVTVVSRVDGEYFPMRSQLRQHFFADRVPVAFRSEQPGEDYQWWSFRAGSRVGVFVRGVRHRYCGRFNGFTAVGNRSILFDVCDEVFCYTGI